MGKKNVLLERILISIILVYCLGILIHILTHREQYQGDFQVYYYAAKAYTQGLNPYDTNALSQVAQKEIGLKFVYPPATLLFFRLFLAVNYTTAFYLFLLLKCALLAVLLYMWRKIFLEEIDVFFYLFCVLAFNGTIYIDLGSGNVSILEQFLIWFAFYWYLKNKHLLFCVLIVIAAIFKLTPIVFLVVLYFSKHKQKYLSMAVSLLSFLFVLLFSYIRNPSLFMSFIRNTTTLNQKRGILIPSTFSLITNVSRFLAENHKVVVPSTVQTILYVAILATILFVSWRARNMLRASTTQDITRIEIFFACVVYTLILPHFRNYSYILLIVPAYFIFRQMRYLPAYPFIFILAILSAVWISLPGFALLFAIFWEYYPLAIAYLVWGLYLYHFSTSDTV